MTIEVEISDELYARAQAESSRRGISQKALLLEALESLLYAGAASGSAEEEKIAATYRKAISNNPDAFALDPALERMQFECLAREEW